MLTCKECGAPVKVDDDDNLQRTCDHESAPVIAEMAADCFGQASLS
jgi:hypothetical protein